MATITSAASGNWSDTATWVGGVVPTAADDVIIGAGHTVAANVDITVLTISGAANITSNLSVTTNRTITCTGANGITAKSVNNGLGLVRISTPGIVVNINSNIRCPLVGSSYGIDVLASCTVNIVGIISHTANGGTASSAALNIGAAALVNVTGDLFGAVGSVGISSAIYPNAGCILNITGNLFAGSSTNSAVYNGVSTCEINITGNLFASISTAFSSTAASNIKVTGIIYANTNVGLSSTNISSIVTVSTPCFNAANGIMAVYAPNIKLINAGSSQWQFATDIVATNKTLYSAGTELGNPAVTDVRNGTTYASGALTGTLEVPPTSSVAVGVPVDNTVGTAMISISDMGALLASYNV
jgi:hypothetical protein